MITVAVSGPDNVGKSTQIRLLARRAGVTGAGPLDAHDPRWADAHALGLADWWFRRAPLEEVVDVLACSYLARAAAAAPAGSVRLVDRGLPMLEASVAATAAVREDLSYEAAAQRAADLLAGYRGDLERAEAAEWGVLLLHAAGPSAVTMRYVEIGYTWRVGAGRHAALATLLRRLDGDLGTALAPAGDVAAALRPFLVLTAPPAAAGTGRCGPAAPSATVAENLSEEHHDRPSPRPADHTGQ